MFQFLLLAVLLTMDNKGVTGHPMKRAASTCTPPQHSGRNGQCSCIDGIVHCSQLVGLPSFVGTPRYFRVEIVDSNINLLNNNSFKGLDVEQLDLHLNDFSDSKMNNHAFEPLKDKLKTLNLAKNRLSKLPNDLLDLTKLERLNVVDNPIDHTGYDEEIMRHIGKTLLEFHFGSKYDLFKWPETMKHLQMLKVLEVDGGDFNTIPQRAFYGFEGTLRKLTIQNTNLVSVPLAVVTLNFLDTLHFDHNKLVGDAGMNVPLVTGLLPYLQNASLRDDGINVFPLILGKFDNLKNLNLDANALNFVSDLSAKTVSRVTFLSLRNSGINRIPGALQFMTSMQKLDMSNNTIHGIEQNDLANLTNLQMLNVSFNPILYVSPYAFSGLHSSLNVIDLRNTEIKQIPTAIRDLSASHITLDLTGDQIECTCELKWLLIWKNANRKTLDIRGECETIVSSINDYIQKTLTLCP